MVGVLRDTISLLAYRVVFWEMTQAPMARVSAVREPSMVLCGESNDIQNGIQHVPPATEHELCNCPGNVHVYRASATTHGSFCHQDNLDCFSFSKGVDADAAFGMGLAGR